MDFPSWTWEVHAGGSSLTSFRSTRASLVDRLVGRRPMTRSASAEGSKFIVGINDRCSLSIVRLRLRPVPSRAARFLTRWGAHRSS